MKLDTKGTASYFLVWAMFVPFLCLSTARAPWPSGPGSVTEIASMHTARASQSCTLLPNGKVLIAGGFAGSGGESNPYRTTELYDPRAGVFEPAASMSTGRSGHTATLLKNGKVLVVGGWTGRYQIRRSAELYDPATNTFTSTGNLVVERAGATATALPDGRVLIAGGEDREENKLASAEIYDPATGVFTLTGSMAEPRAAHTATALKDGKVLIAGGGSGHYPSQNVYRSAELFDLATGKFSATGDMTVGRHKHAAILLRNGKVLIVGGSDNRDWRGEYASAEIYDPSTGTFKATGTMHTARFKIPEAVALLPNGKVLVAGGGSFAELYDESTGTFTKVPGSLEAARFFANVTGFPDGKVLITGGYADDGSGLPATPAAWLYQP
ncbi:MAG TPA: kelch repeat-containing protein [Candidatus Solibacter sp.]|nr:kelch repeat-containing protein [Candidatus Solibacter sp.]